MPLCRFRLVFALVEKICFLPASVCLSSPSHSHLPALAPYFPCLALCSPSCLSLRRLRDLLNAGLSDASLPSPPPPSCLCLCLCFSAPSSSACLPLAASGLSSGSLLLSAFLLASLPPLPMPASSLRLPGLPALLPLLASVRLCLGSSALPLPLSASLPPSASVCFRSLCLPLLADSLSTLPCLSALASPLLPLLLSPLSPLLVFLPCLSLRLPLSPLASLCTHATHHTPVHARTHHGLNAWCSEACWGSLSYQRAGCPATCLKLVGASSVVSGSGDRLLKANSNALEVSYGTRSSSPSKFILLLLPLFARHLVLGAPSSPSASPVSSALPPALSRPRPVWQSLPACWSPPSLSASLPLPLCPCCLCLPLPL